MPDHLRPVATSLGITLCLVMFARNAVAQTTDVSWSSVHRQPVFSAPVRRSVVEMQRQLLADEALTGRTQAAQARPSRDSLKNGAIIGAIIGAAAFGTFAGVLCKATEEPGSNQLCLRDTLRFAAIGAAIGTGGGLAIDAAFSRDAGVMLRVGMKF